MKTEYKGYTIHKLKVNFHVASPDFNPKGYATLNNAKGAITKYLNARLEQSIAQIPTAKVRALVKPVVQSRNKREGSYKQREHIRRSCDSTVKWTRKVIKQGKMARQAAHSA